MEFLDFLKTENLIDESSEEFEEAVSDVVSGILKAGVKQVSSGIIDIEAQKKKLDESKMKRMAGDMAASKVKAHLEIKESVKKLKENITKICQEIESKKDAKALPIYIMVDELDRCRPSFAIEFLELIKHFFDVKGLMFILATDQSQLQHSVRAVYGSGLDGKGEEFDGQGYLRRFFDLELALPTMPKENYINALCTKHGLDKRYSKKTMHLFDDLDDFISSYAQYTDFFGLSLRDIERGIVLTEIALILMIEEKINFLPTLFGFLIAARQRDIKFYNKIGTSLKTVDYIVDAVEKLTEKPGYFHNLSVQRNDNMNVQDNKKEATILMNELREKQKPSSSLENFLLQIKERIDIGARYIK